MLQRWFLIAALAANGAAWAQDPATTLQTLAPGEWLSYTVAVADDAPYVCCMQWEGAPRERVCELDGRHWNFSSTRSRAASELRVLVERGATGVARVRALDAQCALDAGTKRMRAAGAMQADASARWLAGLVPGLAQRERDTAVAALAMHAGPVATEHLSVLARNASRTAREPAIFWLGQTRGEAGARVLVELIGREHDARLREHSIFSLSQNDSDYARDRLRDFARPPHPQAVRGKALFWLTQQGDADAERLIDAVLSEPGLDRGMRDEAVFALSQLPDGRGTRALRALLTANHDRATRKQALFWLAQQPDDEALDTLEALLERPAR
jgi:HEAT repeat protein